MPKKPIIWILSDKRAKFYSQLRLASSLNKNFNIYFLITYKKNIEFTNFKYLKKPLKETPNNSKKSVKKKFKWGKKIFNNSPFGIFYYLFFIFSNTIKVKKTMVKNMPTILLLNGDRSGPSFETIMLILAKKFKLKVVLPYLSVINSGKVVRIKNPDTYKLNFFSKILINQNYKFKYKSEYYGFYTLSQYIVLKILNCITKNPFSIGNHVATSILCLDTPSTFEQISKNLTQTQKVRYVGRHEYVYLAKHQNEKKEKVLLSLPQLFEHNILDWDTHIKFIKQIIKIITNEHHLTISLHPKSEYDNYKFLEKKFNCQITKEPIYKELVKSKLFISVNSSIAIWSTLLGIKTIILNFFDLEMEMFKNLKSLIYVYNFDELKLELLNNEPINYEHDWLFLNKTEQFSNKSEKLYRTILENIQ